MESILLIFAGMGSGLRCNVLAFNVLLHDDEILATDRSEAMKNVYSISSYTLKEIAVHYNIVSLVVSRCDREIWQCKTCPQSSIFLEGDVITVKVPTGNEMKFTIKAFRRPLIFTFSVVFLLDALFIRASFENGQYATHNPYSAQLIVLLVLIVGSIWSGFAAKRYFKHWYSGIGVASLLAYSAYLLGKGFSVYFESSMALFHYRIRDGEVVNFYEIILFLFQREYFSGQFFPSQLVIPICFSSVGWVLAYSNIIKYSYQSIGEKPPLQGAGQNNLDAETLRLSRLSIILTFLASILGSVLTYLAAVSNSG